MDLRPLRYAAFRYLAAGRFVTMLGNTIAPIALAFAVLDLTGSVRDLGLVVGARSLMSVVFLLVGGVVADRFPRQRVMVVAGLLAAGTQAAVAALVLGGAATIPALVALSAVNGVVSAFAFPASAALVPQTVPADQIKPANAINRLGINTATIAGASVGGVLIAAVGPGWGLAADALTFGLSAACFALIRVAPARRPAAAAGRRNPLAELRDGWREFASRQWVWVVVLGFMAINAAMAGGINVLGPAVADDGIGRRLWGLVLAVQTVGMVAGAVVAMRIHARRLLLVGVASMAAIVPFLLSLAWTPGRFAVLAGSAFVFGVGVEQFNIAWETSMQQHIPAERLARVYSYDALGSFLAIPLGQVAIGPLALAVGADTSLVIAAAVVALSVAGMLLSRDVRGLEVGLPADPSPPATAAVAPEQRETKIPAGLDSQA